MKRHPPDWVWCVLGMAIGAAIVLPLKLSDLRAVRRGVPDLTFAESWNWPLYEARDLPAEQQREWVRLKRAGLEVKWTMLDG